jgi:hypothetical protein
MAALLLGGCVSDSVEPDLVPDGGAVDAMAIPAADAGAAGFPDVAASTGKPPQDPACDLNGRWLVAQRVLAAALGQEQTSHNWFYYEIRHEGPDVVVTKGLHCGFEVVKRSTLAASVDSSGAWPAFLRHNSSTGRRGTFVAEGGGCRLRLEREYVVRGATVAHYSNPANALPTRAQKAEGQAPGWEDWDADGNPGISLVVSSALASGTVYTCQRDWTEYDGPTTAGPRLKVPLRYAVEQVALGRAAGAPQIIESTAAPSSDPAQHFAWFHRLGAGEAATGSDAEICAAVRSLAPRVVPEAHQ